MPASVYNGGSHSYEAGQWSWDFGDHNHLNKPDAVDDTGVTSEDTPVRLELLTNDDDANAWDGIRIGSASNPAHGTAVVSADGQSVLYTPDSNYKGADDFTYSVYNLKGSDTANVSLTVKAVADAPNLAVEVVKSASDPADVVTLRLTAAVTDNSEYIDRFEFTGLPSGTSLDNLTNGMIDEPGTPGTVIRDVKLRLPLNQDSNFDLGVSAISKEVSNGSEAKTTKNTGIVLDANSTQVALNFQAQNQSIWSTGDQFVFNDSRFIGVDFDRSGSVGGLIYASVNAALKAGLQSDLTFKGGEIDATLPYNITVSTNYNRTTDVLLISPSATLTSSASFQTVGPQGGYNLDFIFNYALSAEAGIDLGFLENYSIPLGSIGPSSNTTNLLSLDSKNLPNTINLPFGIQDTLAWPNITTSGAISRSDIISSEGASNNFLQLDVDVDQALADIFLGGADPFNINVDFGIGSASIELLNFVLSGGANFLEKFDLQSLGLSGTMRFENGTSQAFTTGSDVNIPNASSLDVNKDGRIDFDLAIAPNATLHNETDLGFNVGYSLDLLKLSGSYDIGIASDSFDIGPVVHEPGNAQVASIPVFNETFPLSFLPENASFVV